MAHSSLSASRPQTSPAILSLPSIATALLLASVTNAAEVTLEVIESPSVSEIDFEPPDFSKYELSRLRESTPAPVSGTVEVVAAAGKKLLEEALRRHRGDDIRLRQNTEDIRVIAIGSGVISLDQLVEQVSDRTIVDREGEVTTLRLPLLIEPGGVLVVNGQSTPVLRLSTDRGAFIVNAGKLYVDSAEITGWDEAAGSPRRFVKSSDFRPFLASLVRSETVFLGSRFSCLGFAAPTAYGVSLSSHPERTHGPPSADSPTGVFVGNTFENLYYGFYSYEARDVAIVDNTYSDCIVYAIDPHDRTTGLLIARNRTHGTRQKHGIIGSRGVSDSLIIDNTSYNNGGSGIMLDRECNNITVANNQVYGNKQGIAIYESSGNQLLGNVIGYNKSSGLRIRNSVDIIAGETTLVGNGDFAIDASARELDDQAERDARGEQIHVHVAAKLLGVRVANNYGLLKSKGAGELLVSSISTASDHRQLGDTWAVSERPHFGSQQSFRLGGELKGLHDASLVEQLGAQKALLIRGDGP